MNSMETVNNRTILPRFQNLIEDWKEEQEKKVKTKLQFYVTAVCIILKTLSKRKA